MIITSQSRLKALAISTNWICARLGLPRERPKLDQHTGAARFAAEIQVFGDAHAGNRRKLLGNDRDAILERFGRRLKIDALSLEQDLSGIALGDTHDDAKEGRLPSSVPAA
jgi:hypothetical protein